MFADKEAASGKSFLICFCIAGLILAVDVKTNILNSPRAFLSYALYPVSFFASVPSRFFGKVDDLLLNEPDIENAYELLRVEYAKLKADALRRGAIELENQRLRSLLGTTERSKIKMQIAKSIKIDLDPYQHRVLVNKGVVDAIYKGQAIIDDKGVVGQVTDVFRSASVVTLLTDPAHSIPVKIRRNGRHLLAEGSGDLGSLRIPFLNKNIDIRQGDILETSGLGGRFPAGYPVATVSEVITSSDESFLEVSAAPIAGVASLDYILFVASETTQSLSDNKE